MTPGHHPKSKIACECLKVSEAEVVRAIRTCQIRTVRDIIDYTQAGDGCTACHPLLAEYLERERRKEKDATPSPRPPSAESDSSRARPT